MIDLMKRLAELDSKNPNVVYEGRVKDLSQDLKSMTDAEFKAAHKMTKAECRKKTSEKKPDDKKTVKEGFGQPGGYPNGDPDMNDASDEQGNADWAQSLLNELEGLDLYSMRDVMEVGSRDLQSEFQHVAQKLGVDPSRDFSRVQDEVMQDLQQMISADKVPEQYGDNQYEESLEPSDRMSNLAECGMSPMPGMGSGPANISITAGSGSELSGMLKDIMSLAGLNKSEPEPAMVQPAGQVYSDQPSMRSVVDTLHSFDDESEMDEPETDEITVSEYDNTPDDATDVPEFDANEFSNAENKPAGGNTATGKSRVNNQPTATFEQQLMRDYQSFIAEAKPSAGMSAKEKSAVVKKAKAGKDIGKPGKGFEKVEKAAAKSGAKDPKAVAAAAMWKTQAKKK